MALSYRLMCPFQYIYCPIKDRKRTRVRLEMNVAPCSRQTTYVIDPLHECKKVCPCTKALPQSGIRAWIKQGRRKRKKRGKTEARRLMERKAAQQNKNTSEELKQGLPSHSLDLALLIPGRQKRSIIIGLEGKTAAINFESIMFSYFFFFKYTYT